MQKDMSAESSSYEREGREESARLFKVALTKNVSESQVVAVTTTDPPMRRWREVFLESQIDTSSPHDYIV
jgi:hypothetical protein